jgi:hypothetical protein
MINNKPEPFIEKIVLTPQQQEDVKNILKGYPKPDVIERHRKQGWDVDLWLKHRIPTTMNYRNYILKKQYFGGICHGCSGWPDLKLLYKYDGAILKEYYCNPCYSKVNGDNE